MTSEQFKIEILPWSVKLYPMAKRMLKSDSEAQDAVQDVMMKLWDNRKKLSGIDNLRGYVLVLCRNHCLDLLKKKRVQLPNSDEDQTLINHSEDITNFEAQEKLAIVHQVIDSLPEKYREVICFREIDGLDFDQIKTLTGLEIPHIRVILSRARIKIKEEIRKIYEYEQKGYQRIAR